MEQFFRFEAKHIKELGSRWADYWEERREGSSSEGCAHTGSPLQATGLEHADNDPASWDTAKVALARAAYGREAPGLKCRSLQLSLELLAGAGSHGRSLQWNGGCRCKENHP